MSVRKSISWSAGTQAFGFLVGFASSIVLARLLTPRQLGIYAVALATQGVLTTFTSFSVAAYIVREGELSRETLRRTFTVNALLACALAAALQVAAWISGAAAGEPAVATVLRILSISPLLGAVEFVPASLLGREMNFRALSIVSVARSIVATGCTVALAFAGLGAASLALGQVAGAVVSAIACNLARPRDLILRPTFSGLWPIFQFGLQLMSISGVAQLASRMSDLVLGRMLGLAALGLYARASSISSMIFDNVYGLVTRVLFAKLSQDLREKGSLHDVYLRSLGLLTGLLWPLLIGLAVLSRPAVHILYGDRWLPAALPLSFLMIAQFIVLGFGMNWELFVLRRETALQTRFELFRAVFGVATFAVGSLFSIAAAALGRVVEAGMGYLLYRPHMDRMVGAAPGELERVYGQSLLLTAVAVAPALVLMLATGWQADVNPLLLAGAVLLGVASWFAVLVTRGHAIIDELAILRRFVLGRRGGARLA